MTRSFDIVLVAAVARNRVIGSGGGMPWHLPADLRRFKAITIGKPMVMGRKTFEAIGRPLPGRRTVVVTRDPDWSADGVEVAGDLESALELAARGGSDEIVVAGGGEIYAQAMGRADRLRLTWIEADPEGDAHFPELDPTVWREVAREAYPAEGGRPAYAFVDYARR